MRIARYQEAVAFAKHATPLLMRDETVNHLILGILSDLTGGSPNPSAKEALLCAIDEDDGQPIAVAVNTGISLVLTEMPLGAMDVLLDFLAAEKIAVSMTSGPSQAVGRFADRWAQRNRLTATLGHSLRIMRLESVAPMKAVPGVFREAVMEDVPTLATWADAFTAELKLELSSGRTDVERRISRHRLFVWCDSQLVSMAGCAGPTANGIRINFVYTPPEFRRRGYASACVAALSQRLLAGGKKFVFLYVEAGNSTTNRIYQAIGYEVVCDWEDYRFQENLP